MPSGFPGEFLMHSLLMTFRLDILIFLNSCCPLQTLLERKTADPPILHFGPGETRLDDAIMINTPVVKAALAMGFNRRLVRQTVQSQILTAGENYKTVSDLVSALLNAEDENRIEEKERQAEETASDDLSLIRRRRMPLFQQLTCVLPILDNLLKTNVINKQEHDIIKQKTQVPL
ncbi:baculoviral IAP repeat-containing protein 2-like [Sorex fumeus]|uniref:baculoviral IAP repeat-containing protein 2-like n=1 Tax=Sorex fumeus TaxID=62283 RepID=UPI0024AD4D07|nr:baculoviral IAP repeat-containing protein 2-like [Sorex fumeus]